MKLILILTIISGFLVGCLYETPTRTPKYGIETRCINGVSYYLLKEAHGQRGYGLMAPNYKRDGTLVLCEIKKEKINNETI